MKTLKLNRCTFVFSLFIAAFCLFSSLQVSAYNKISTKITRVLKGASWLNYPNAINGSRGISFCADVVDESTIIPQGPVKDGDRVCPLQTFRFTLPFNCASVTWGMYNAYVFYSYSSYDKVFKFDSNIYVDGWASIWVTVIDPVTNDPYFYEMAFEPWVECTD